MTFPSGGPGYPQRGGGPQPQTPVGYPPQQAPSGTLSVANLTVLLALAVALLGLVNYFLTFTGDAAPADGPVTFLLVGGLIAALRVLPKAPRVLPFAALFSVLGALQAILVVV